jgi:hypothetical protein
LESGLVLFHRRSPLMYEEEPESLTGNSGYARFTGGY